jgi:hypothetical protein
MEEVAEEVI